MVLWLSLWSIIPFPGISPYIGKSGNFKIEIRWLPCYHVVHFIRWTTIFDLWGRSDSTVLNCSNTVVILALWRIFHVNNDVKSQKNKLIICDCETQTPQRYILHPFSLSFRSLSTRLLLLREWWRKNFVRQFLGCPRSSCVCPIIVVAAESTSSFGPFARQSSPRAIRQLAVVLFPSSRVVFFRSRRRRLVSAHLLAVLYEQFGQCQVPCSVFLCDVSGWNDVEILPVGNTKFREGFFSGWRGFPRIVTVLWSRVGLIS